jgi:hypothetical protein
VITRPALIVTCAVILAVAAMAWAQGDGSTDGAPLVQGDADCDLDVDAVDALHVLRSVAGLNPAPGCLAASDVNCNGQPDAVDALRILRHVAVLPPHTPAGCTPIGAALPTPAPAECPAATPPPSPSPTPTPFFFSTTVVTLCNETSQAVNGLHIAFSQSEPAASLFPVTHNAPGCPTPTYDYKGNFPPVYTSIDVIWSERCVDPGETVTLEFGTDCPEPACHAPHVLACDWLLNGVSIGGCNPPSLTPTPTSTRVLRRRQTSSALTPTPSHTHRPTPNSSAPSPSTSSAQTSPTE